MAIVTVSRETGTGGEDISRALAKRLGYRFVSKQEIHKEIEEHGKHWVKWVEGLDEHAPSIWERYDRSYAAYQAIVAHCVYRHALKNNVVILGRGGNYLLESVPYALRIRITASMEFRAKTLIERYGIDEASAREMLKHSDNERATYLKRAFRKDWTDSADYDMVLNSGQKSFDGIVDLIAGEIPVKEKRVIPENEAILSRLELASRVRADILTHFSMFLPSLEVVYDGTAIVLRGFCLIDKAKIRELEEIAKKSAGDIEVRSEVTCPFFWR